MIIVADIAERDLIESQVLTISNPDGTWTVYQEGDEIPAEYSWIFGGA